MMRLFKDNIIEDDIIILINNIKIIVRLIYTKI